MEPLHCLRWLGVASVLVLGACDSGTAGPGGKEADLAGSYNGSSDLAGYDLLGVDLTNVVEDLALVDQASAPDLSCTSAAMCGGRVCVTMVCADCTDDGQCVDGYGDGYLCAGGTCVVGDCHADGDCADGTICCANQCADAACCGPDDTTHCIAPAGFVCSADGECVCPPRAPDQIAVMTGGDDTSGNGSTVCPFRTIGKALAIATADPSAAITITVGAGTFNAASGETYPMTIGRSGIALSGAGATDTKLVASLSGALLTLTGATNLSGLALTNNGSGPALVVSAPVGIATSAVKGGSVGIKATAGANLTAAATVVVADSTTGIEVGNSAIATVSADIHGNGTGVSLLGGGLIYLVNAQVHDNSGTGIVFADDAVSNTYSKLDTVAVQNNGGHGVAVTLNSRVIVRRAIIVGNGQNGVNAVGASVQLDLGSLADSGANVLNRSTARNGGVGLCNLTTYTLTAANDTFATCPPTASSNCTGGADYNTAVFAPNCSAQ